MKTVNKNDLAVAHQSKQLLDPAIQALKKINVQALGHDPYALEKLNSFVAWLQKFEVKADAVISQAQDQIDNRPKHIISAATSRMFQIPDAIEVAEKNIQGLTKVHAEKCEVMRRQGFSEAEIESISPFPQSEIDSSNSTIVCLKSELKKIEEFLGSSPVYDVSLLDMEKLQQFIQSRKPAE